MINSKNQTKDYTLSIDKLREFQKKYIEKYNNFYKKRFNTIDPNRGKIERIEIYKEIRRKIVKKGKIPHIVYEIFDNDTGFIRVGRSSYPPKKRFYWYLLRAFSPNLPVGLATIYYEMAKCKSKKEAMKRFKITVRYIFDSRGEAQIMEEFLTIFRNQANNSKGYDLSINNEYNKVVGDLFKQNLGGNFLSGELNPIWKDLPPNPLADAVLEGLGMTELKKKFRVSAKTIRRRFNSYGYGIKEIYDLKDARAFLLKPYIIEGFKMGLDQECFFNYLDNMGINIFNQFDFKPNTAHNRGAFFRRMLEQIWNVSKHKEARYQIISEYILSIIDRPDITPGKAKEELSKIIDFKYDRELARICQEVFNMNLREKRDEIFKPIIENSALNNWNERKIQLKIAIDIGLCKETDSVDIRDRASHWVKQFVNRHYGIPVSKLPNYLNPNLSKPKSLKELIYDYMEQNPLERPKSISKKFRNINIQTIRVYVKSWKKENKNKIFKHSQTSALKYTSKMDLDKKIKDLTIKLLKSFLRNENPSLNMEWKGIIAGAIYLASIIENNPISQVVLAKFIGVDDHTISKRYREIAESLNL